jgi:predicted MPP superfamily phosphohydrolase
MRSPRGNPKLTARRAGPLAWLVSGLLVACGPTQEPGGPVVVLPSDTAAVVPLPNHKDGLRFAVLGDFGTGQPQQYQMAAEMARIHQRFPFELVVLVGDNLYGGESPESYRSQFEIPYKALLDSGVTFYASLGNHDGRNQRYYKHFNMGGKFYYSLKAPAQSVRFFFLDSGYPDSTQIAWVEKELKGSNEDWKIAVFHHPLYSSARAHGSDVSLRKTLEPLFVEYNVSVVLTGHDHTYERVKPQHGIVYFVVGSGGKLRPGDLNPRSGLTARGFDRDNAFMVGEIVGDSLFFQAVSRTGKVVDSGVLLRRLLVEDRASP